MRLLRSNSTVATEPETDDMLSHESHREPELRGDAESPLQSAARFLGRTASAGGEASSGQRRILQGRQERDLEAWARESGCWLDAGKVLSDFVRGGEEHRICRGDNLYRKATYPGRYGFTVIAAMGEPTLTHALPGEYLNRLLLSNRVFDDEVKLIGVAQEAEGIVILTTQPTIVGEAATKDEMADFFACRRFDLLPGFCAGYKGSLSFYRDLDQVAVFDAHPANYIRDHRGIVFPIDGVLVEAGDVLTALLELLR
jgi:hypothetical protein